MVSRNIEIKAFLKDRAAALATAARLSGSAPEIIRQQAIFFRCERRTLLALLDRPNRRPASSARHSHAEAGGNRHGREDTHPLLGRPNAYPHRPSAGSGRFFRTGGGAGARTKHTAKRGGRLENCGRAA